MRLNTEAAQIPVLGEADTVVAGGSLAGIACALRLVKSGQRVWLVEPRTYMGRELTATLRPWLELPADGLPMPELIEYVLNAQVRGEAPESSEATESKLAGSGADFARGDCVPLYPDRLKLSLEDALEKAGVRFLYASLPVGLEEKDGRITGIVIANKSGRQLIRCRQVVDATETALIAALGGEDENGWVAGEKALFYRTLEFAGVDADLEPGDSRTLPVEEEAGVAGNAVRLRQGYRGRGHVYVEFGLELSGANGLAANRDREAEARVRSMRLAIRLLQREESFRKAVLSASSHELYGPFPLDVAGLGISEAQEELAGEAAVRATGVRSIRRDAAGEWLDPLGAASLGERLGREMAKEAAKPAAAGQSEAGIRDAHPSPADRTYSSPADRAHPGPADATEADGDIVVRIPSLGEADGVFPLEKASAASLPVLESVDVLVLGGGSSGACAAITAAGEGVRTALVDLNSGLGGTGTFGGVDSYWFGRKAGYAARIQEAVLSLERELHYKGHKWNIEAKMHVLLEQALRGGVDLLLNAITFGVLMRGNRVAGAVVATRWGPVAIAAEATIDATGDGDAAAFAGAPFVYGSEKDHAVMWYSLAQFTAPNKIQNNFTSMVDVSNALDYTRAILAGRRRGTDVHDHGAYVATRESRHIKGDVVMKLTDQLLQRRWPDVINVHFSNHDVKGVSGADWVNVGLIPPNLEIEIPYRMLLPEGLEGLLLAGKAISATHDALPAIRMQADLENLGAAAALAAVQAVRAGVSLRGIDLPPLQRRLAAEGLLPGNAADRTLCPIAYTDEELERLVDSIEADMPLYEYSNMRMNEIYEGPIPFVEICSVGPRIVPFLERALGRSEGTRRIRLAQALAMVGSNAGVPALVEAILGEWNGAELPPRTADIMYVQLPPDHGAMPDAAYLLYSLAQAKDRRAIAVWRRAAELLRPSEDDFKDTWKGLFYYVDAVCQGAERLGDPDAVPVLEQLRRIPYLRDQQSGEGYQPDYFLERRAMLELAIGRALACCGSPEGYEVLIRYLSDVRSLLSKQALQHLRRLSGECLPKEPDVWTAWLNAARSTLRLRPFDVRLDIETASETLLRQVCEKK
ncbi:FAD-dependent oxidoreductase [Cohnella zeiphila]|uniref:FAD-dependent oxidoreductase n=1 Tax=Cohnella zeiphila TaxID=2761120 RepID=A0A7X0SVR5_9BACL|nr:FAD-dependent oxidoreductase [Cohnella zeiphila]MBB6735795.1 FAD-dependent oxidoreductase [Cohnella zeiphila]